MDIEFLIDRLERYVLEECPRFLGNRMVSEDEFRGHLAQLRDAVPRQVREARRVVDQREAFIEDAREEANRILERARQEAEEQASSHQFVVDARRQAQIIVKKARAEANQVRADADEYIFDTLSRLQEELTRELRVVENGLHRLETERERTLEDDQR